MLVAALVPLLAVLASFARPLRHRALDLLLVAVTLDLVLSLGAAPEVASTRFAGGYLVVDATSRLFSCLMAIVFLGVLLFARGRMQESPAFMELAPRYVRLAGAALATLQVSSLSNHLVVTWLSIEASTLVVAPLIHHARGASAVRAAWRYLLFSTVGLTVTFLGLVCLAHAMEAQAGPVGVSFFCDELLSRGEAGVDTWRRLGLLFIVFGYGAKLGLAPMHAWLPEAYDRSPPSVTAMLSAMQASAVFCALIRVMQTFRSSDQDLVSYELVAMGLMTMAVSTLRIVTATDYKRLIAYAAMTHNGIVAIGLGVGKGAAYGVVLYVASNALVKALLFLAVGNIKSRYHTRSISGLAGLAHDMPLTGATFMLGIFALLGFAPFGSFLGEVMILSGLIRGGHYAVFVAVCVMLTIILVSTGRAVFPMLWNPAKGAVPTGAAEPVALVVPYVIFLGLLFSLGIFQPSAISAVIRQVAANLAGLS
jgi:hydrogenase-4 component F